MIQNDDELNVVRKQLERAEMALLSLQRDVLPKSVARFNLMAESYVDQITELRSQIEKYLGLAERNEPAREVEIPASAQTPRYLPDPLVLPFVFLPVLRG